MRIAIVGAGMAGLALCWHLLNQGDQVTLFGDPEEGASRISSGLLHPYPGEQARRSWKAEESLFATKELLHVASAALKRPVAHEGILRIAWDEGQKTQLIERTHSFNDITRVGEKEFFISSGMTVFPSLYLKGLLAACREKGAQYSPIKVKTVEQIRGHDCVVLACGAALLDFPEAACLRLNRIKGQALLCEWPSSLPPLERSLVGKGHLARTDLPSQCILGSTYERDYLSEEPCLETAKHLLFPKIAAFFPEVTQLKVVRCCAGFRVTRKNSYLPLIKKISAHLWAFTALGSRGLLYHAYFAELLASEIKHENGISS
jgi:glycine/D-amino acid oxidase-like deaminating enzyme